MLKKKKSERHDSWMLMSNSYVFLLNDVPLYACIMLLTISFLGGETGTHSDAFSLCCEPEDTGNCSRSSSLLATGRVVAFMGNGAPPWGIIKCRIVKYGSRHVVQAVT